MSLSKISTGNKTNLQWRTVIDAGIDLLNDSILQATTDVTVAAGTSWTDIQALINNQPKNLNGKTLRITFEDGTYDFGTNQLNISGFHGGYLTIQGSNQTLNSDGTGLGCVIESQITGNNGAILVLNCTARVNLKKIEFKQTGTNTDTHLLRFYHATNANVESCSIHNVGTSGAAFKNRGIHTFQSRLIVTSCRFDNLEHVMTCQNSTFLYSNDNQVFSGGSGVLYGIAVAFGSYCSLNSNQIVGNTADFSSTSGGLISNKAGLILDETILTADKTVNIAAGTSVTDIQILINDQPKNLNGYNLTFQFADGTYNFLTTQLNVVGFEGGTVVFQGDTSDTIASDGTGLGVKIQTAHASGESGAIYVSNTKRCVVKFIAFEQTHVSNTTSQILRFYYGTHSRVLSCTFNNLNTKGNQGCYWYDSRGQVTGSRFNNLNNNIQAVINGRVYSSDNASFSGGTNSNNNLRSESGSIITQNNTQAGSTGVGDSKLNGGVIFDSNGAVV